MFCGHTEVCVFLWFVFQTGREEIWSSGRNEKTRIEKSKEKWTKKLKVSTGKMENREISAVGKLGVWALRAWWRYNKLGHLCEMEDRMLAIFFLPVLPPDLEVLPPATARCSPICIFLRGVLDMKNPPRSQASLSISGACACVCMWFMNSIQPFVWLVLLCRWRVKIQHARRWSRSQISSRRERFPQKMNPSIRLHRAGVYFAKSVDMTTCRILYRNSGALFTAQPNTLRYTAAPSATRTSPHTTLQPILKPYSQFSHCVY